MTDVSGTGRQWTKLAVGKLQPDSNLWLAPLAGYTTLPFRLVLREIGGLGLATTELVNVRSLVAEHPAALALIRRTPADRPLAVQLFGAEPDYFRAAAQMVEALGYELVEINMGCPVPKVCKAGAGAALLRDVTLAVRIARAVVDAVKIPVTVKTRLGWDARSIVAPELARALEDAGVSAIIVHGRTQDQGFAGPVNLEGIVAVVRAVRAVPVIGNGDVTTPELAARMLTLTGCAGVSIGRGAFYDPWLFRRSARFLATGELEREPGIPERLGIMSRHLDLMVEFFGESQGCKMFRKAAILYTRGLKCAREFRQKLATLSTRAEFHRFAVEYLSAVGVSSPGSAPVP